MTELKIAVCEDDDMEYKRLVRLLDDSRIPYEHDRFTDGSGLVAGYYKGQYDLLLVDIYMSGMNGLDTMAEIRKLDPDVPAAFLTTSPDHALDGYKYHVDRYIIKPIDPQELFDLLKKAAQTKVSAPTIDITYGGKETRIPLANIRYVEANGHNALLYLTGGQTVKASAKLSELASLLPDPPFCACHKSYIVNFEYVSFLNTELNVFEMNEGGTVHIRRESVGKTGKAYRSYMFALARKGDL